MASIQPCLPATSALLRSGDETSTINGSKSNEDEAKLVVAIIKLLVDQGGMTLHELGVVAPYAAQVQLICRMLPYKTSSRVSTAAEELVQGAPGGFRA